MSGNSSLFINSDGKVILSDARLEELESHFVRARGDGETNAQTCSGTNNECTNTGDCRGSSNSGCMNSRTCNRNQTQ